MNLNLKRQQTKNKARVFDLIDSNNLKSMGLLEHQLWGPIGSLSLENIKIQCLSLGYEYCAYRDPIRPGLLWVENLNTKVKSPWKSFEMAKLVERLCPGLIQRWNSSKTDPLEWEMIYPPISSPHLDYASVLEWLTKQYPHAVVGWVELALTYENDLKLFCSLESLFSDCKNKCSHWKVVHHVLGVEN